MRSGTYLEAPPPSTALSITLVPLGIAFQATVSGHGLGQTAFCFFFRYLDAGDFALVHQNGINHSLFKPAFTGWFEGDRPVVEDAGDFTLGQGQAPLIRMAGKPNPERWQRRRREKKLQSEEKRKNLEGRCLNKFRLLRRANFIRNFFRLEEIVLIS